MSNRELIEKLRRNPRGVMFELEHECADALEKAEAELAAIKAAQSYPGGKGEQRRQLGEPSAISDETVRVPREPTYEMAQAGARLVKNNLPYHTGTVAIYKAMLAAAQEGK